MIGSHNEADSEEEELNQRAFTALLGLSSDWRTDLVALLKSDAPIRWEVRNELAAIIEGQSELALKLSGHQKSVKRIEGLRARREWLSDGKAAAPYVANHPERVDDAFAAAAEELGKDDHHWRRRYYYYKRCRDWMEAVRHSGKFYPTMDDEELEDVWHIASCNQGSESPNPPPANEFDTLRFKRINALWNLFKDKPYGKLAVNTFVRYSEFLPPKIG